MNRMFLMALLAGAAVSAASQPAAAFWQRSQVSRCNDATTEAERQRLRCWELNAYVDPGWPPLGVGMGLGGAYYLGPPAPPVHKGGVTRRLG